MQKLFQPESGKIVLLLAEEEVAQKETNKTDSTNSKGSVTSTKNERLLRAKETLSSIKHIFGKHVSVLVTGLRPTLMITVILHLKALLILLRVNCQLLKSM